MRKIVLCDIDHTVSNAFWRDDMIGGPGGWDAYHAASKDDEPIHDVVNMINAMRAGGMYIVGITARPEKWRKLTMELLVKHGAMFDELLMRPDEAYHPAAEIKLKLAAERFGERFKDEVALIIDDREDVVAAFREAGITALLVHGRQN